jgi:hypothetical protein
MFAFFAGLGCIEAMLGLSEEHLWPYWGGIGMKERVVPRGLGVPGNDV